MILLNELDLEKSFNKLKEALKESESVEREKRFSYAESYLNLKSAVNKHIFDCIGEVTNIPAADPDDIKTVNI